MIDVDNDAAERAFVTSVKKHTKSRFGQPLPNEKLTYKHGHARRKYQPSCRARGCDGMRTRVVRHRGNASVEAWRARIVFYSLGHVQGGGLMFFSSSPTKNRCHVSHLITTRHTPIRPVPHAWSPQAARTGPGGREWKRRPFQSLSSRSLHTDTQANKKKGKMGGLAPPLGSQDADPANTSSSSLKQGSHSQLRANDPGAPVLLVFVCFWKGGRSEEG